MDTDAERKAIATQLSILEHEHRDLGERLNRLAAARGEKMVAIQNEITDIDDELADLGYTHQDFAGNSEEWDRKWTEIEAAGDGPFADRARAELGMAPDETPATTQAAAQADFSAPPRGSAEQQGGFDVGKAMDEYADKNRQAGGKAFPWE